MISMNHIAELMNNIEIATRMVDLHDYHSPQAAEGKQIDKNQICKSPELRLRL